MHLVVFVERRRCMTRGLLILSVSGKDASTCVRACVRACRREHAASFEQQGSWAEAGVRCGAALASALTAVRA
eukprot:861518-Pleurochrysis_carterae.AAC.1